MQINLFHIYILIQVWMNNFQKCFGFKYRRLHLLLESELAVNNDKWAAAKYDFSNCLSYQLKFVLNIASYI